MLKPPSSQQTGGFGDGRINGAIQIFRGLTLVTMVTKIGLFSHKTGHNSAYINTRALEFAPNMGFSGTTDLMVLFTFSLDRSLLPW